MKRKFVVVTRSRPGSEAWMEYVRKRGFPAYYFPAIETQPIDKASKDISSKLKTALRDISHFDWLVFTSAAGPRFLERFLKNSKRQKISVKKMPKIAVIGKQTADAVRKAGYRVALQASHSDSETLAQELAQKLTKELKKSAQPLRSVHPKHRQSVLLLRADIASPKPVALLKKTGARVVDVPIYRTTQIDKPDPKFLRLLAGDRIACITFASPSEAVQGFRARLLKMLRKNMMSGALALPAIAISARVADALKKAGFRKIFTAKKPTIADMIATIRAQGL